MSDSSIPDFAQITPPGPDWIAEFLERPVSSTHRSAETARFKSVLELHTGNGIEGERLAA